MTLKTAKRFSQKILSKTDRRVVEKFLESVYKKGYAIASNRLGRRRAAQKERWEAPMEKKTYDIWLSSRR